MEGTESREAPLQLGAWQILFVFILCAILLLPYLEPVIGVPTASIELIYVLPLAIAVTASLWLINIVSSYIWPGTGLVIGNIIGKYEFTGNWELKRYAFANQSISLDTSSSSPHILIVGGSQSGKSSTIKGLIARFLREERGNLILDYHGEYGYLEEKGFKVIDARAYDPLAPNYEGEKFENIVSDFVESFVVAFESAGDVQLAILKKKLEKHITVQEALAVIESDLASARTFLEKDRLNGLSLRLGKIVRHANGRESAARLVDSNIVFDLSGIRDRDCADFYAESILRRCLALLIERGSPTNIIIDEAHRLNTRALHERGIEPSLSRAARECGKFSGRLVVASQNITDFPSGFSSNFGNILCFRAPSGADLQVLEQLTGIRYGMLQSTMNGLHKGEALLIGPHSHYSLVKVSSPPDSAFSRKRLPELESESDRQIAQPELQGARVPRSDEIFEELKKGGALTVTALSSLTGYPMSAVWRNLQALTKKRKVIRYEETETPEGLFVYYEVNNPHRQESAFHKLLISKAEEALSQAGKVRVAGGYDNPDLILDGTVAVEVETGLKPELSDFRKQVEKRFGQGYSKIIVIVINQRQRARYEKALGGMKNVRVAKFTEIKIIFKK